MLANLNPVAVDTGITLTANVDDSTTGGSDIASAEFTIDGGTPVAMLAQVSPFDSVSEDVTASIGPFSTPAVLNICVSGTDAASNVGAEECIFLAVYDPSGGFVSGGGWIDSPADACVSFCGGATGKAKFGFVSKYKKGASVPSGQTQFQFKAGDLNFHSTSYDFLVIAGARAIYKGDGTVNGDAGFTFQLNAVDGQIAGGGGADKFRIKIKDSSDTVIYDNEISETDPNADPTTTLGGGSIKIHKGK